MTTIDRQIIYRLLVKNMEKILKSITFYGERPNEIDPGINNETAD